MLLTILARPTLIVARVIPTVRTSRSICDFRSAKTCSTREAIEQSFNGPRPGQTFTEQPERFGVWHAIR